MKYRHFLRGLCAALLCVCTALALAACGKDDPEAPETNADGMTRPVPLADATEPLTDEDGNVVTNADGSVVMVDKPKVATTVEGTTQPRGSNDWAQTAAPGAGRYDLYKPGNASLNSPTEIHDFVQTGRIAWPSARLPAAVPVAAQYIDRLDDQEGDDGTRRVTFYVTEMPYDVFLNYAARLKEAGLAAEADMVSAEAPPLRQSILTGKLGDYNVIIAWTPEKATGFIANFQLQIEGAGF